MKLGRGTIALLAATAGIAVANLYYNQPLLPEIAHDLGITPKQAALVPSMTQVGYGLGILLIAPLGDQLERRRMMMGLLMVVAASLAAIAASSRLETVAGFSLTMGMTCILAHVILPYVGQNAPPEQRGKLVGQILSGVLIGILLSRTLSGAVGHYLGWRAVFALASGVAIGLMVVVRTFLGESRGAGKLTYLQILGSMRRLFLEQPVLREACGVGAAMFGAFSSFWSTLAFRLAESPYHMGSREAGLFGLIGAVGAMAAPLVGKLADKRGSRYVIGVAIALVAASFALMGATDGSLPWLVVGVIVMDLGVQAAMVSNQARIYGLVPGSESRLNAIYMVVYFAGGSLGSSLAARAWEAGRWPGVVGCALGFVAFGSVAHWRGRQR